MTERELIEAAAKFVGITGEYVNNVPIQGAHRTGIWNDLTEKCWNPLTDNGDAFWLMVKLSIPPDFVAYPSYPAMRRAIVRAAVKLGDKK